MRCVILQPSYIPWRGYFHQICKADVFVLYDDMQYDKHGWRNRNRIKTHQGTTWLTIPVYTQGITEQHTPINQIRINWSKPWNHKHWQSIYQAYSKAPFFEAVSKVLEPFYLIRPTLLSEFTIDLTITLARYLGIEHTRFIRSSSLSTSGTKTDRLLDILIQLGATHYITGPSAQSYLEVNKLQEAGISLEYMVYNYREYDQLYPPYDPQVSIIDLLFMTGPKALGYIIGEASQVSDTPPASSRAI